MKNITGSLIAGVIAIMIFSSVEAATTTNAETVSVTVNGFGSWEEAYAAEKARLAAMGLK